MIDNCSSDTWYWKQSVYAYEEYRKAVENETT